MNDEKRGNSSPVKNGIIVQKTEAVPLPEICCGSCRYWLSLRPSEKGNERKQPGECRLNPPTVHIAPVQTLTGAQMGGIPILPQTTADFFCSRHPDMAAIENINQTRPLIGLVKGVRNAWEKAAPVSAENSANDAALAELVKAVGDWQIIAGARVMTDDECEVFNAYQTLAKGS